MFLFFSYTTFVYKYLDSQAYSTAQMQGIKRLRFMRVHTQRWTRLHAEASVFARGGERVYTGSKCTCTQRQACLHAEASVFVRRHAEAKVRLHARGGNHVYMHAEANAGKRICTRKQKRVCMHKHVCMCTQEANAFDRTWTRARASKLLCPTFHTRKHARACAKRFHSTANMLFCVSHNNYCLLFS